MAASCKKPAAAFRERRILELRSSATSFATPDVATSSVTGHEATLIESERIVKAADIEELSANEQKVLDRSFQSALREKRVRNVLLSAGMTLTGVALFWVYGMGATAITAMALVIVAISALEKVTYAREILVYKSLVRSLVHKLEDLQHLEPTPLDGHPAARARLREHGTESNLAGATE